MNKKITLKQIAEHFQLSISTISKALNDSHEISADTKSLIRAYAKKVDYIPDQAARGLKTGKTNIIAVIVPFISSSFFIDFYEEISKKLLDMQYQVMLLQTFNDEETESEALMLCLKNKVEGIVMCPVKNNSNLKQLQHISENICPVIIFDRINHQLATYKIGIQNNREIYRATDLLIKNGRSRVALLCCKDIGGNTSRIKGYKDALYNNGLNFEESLVAHISYNTPKDDIEKILEQKIRDFMVLPDRPTALLATTDTLSIKILGVLNRLGIQVPEEVAVMGFSNTPFANSLHPPLTVIEQPSQKMAERALELLKDLLRHKNKRIQGIDETFFLECKLDFRESFSKK